MGKPESELLPSDVQALEEGRRLSEGNAFSISGKCLWVGRKVRFRCLAALVLGLAVLLSAIFWLPFLNAGAHRDRLRDRFGSKDFDFVVFPVLDEELFYISEFKVYISFYWFH